MTDEEREVYQEVTTSQAPLASLHPLRLDRWHRTLLGLPGRLYMQLGIKLMFEHVDASIRGIRPMVELLGDLPLTTSEIARRQVNKFSWHVPSKKAETGTHSFSVEWDKEKSSWKLHCLDAEGQLVLKTVASIEQAVDKSWEWAAELDEA